MNKLTPKHFSFKCPMNWDLMKVSENGRFCEKCRKEVLDLTNCSIDEVIALQRKHGPICGSIRVAQVAAVAVSLSAAACQNVPVGRTTGKIPSHGEKERGPLDGAALGYIESAEKIERTNETSLTGTPLPPEQLKK